LKKDVEIFECDCQSRDDLIIGKVNTWDYKDDWGKDLTIDFITYLVDSNYSDNLIKKLFWRIKNSLKILFTGEIRTEGYWIPSRVYNSKDDIERIFGYETTKNFAKWLDEKADEIKLFYENKMKDNK